MQISGGVYLLTRSLYWSKNIRKMTSIESIDGSVLSTCLLVTCFPLEINKLLILFSKQMIDPSLPKFKNDNSLGTM